ncbi:hypothetical protein F5Y16DRAFT_425293 [Xylariaceae sp. FL0255]|nr:hypothetical protein F5Y16DRAFT_425293 [Xylariaceae sp. FL0255]
MIRDAIAIIQLPKSNGGGYTSVPHHAHFKSWIASDFPSTHDDQALLDRIDNIYDQLLLFIEDYATKATAACPPWEYLCLPNRGGHLEFKGKMVCTKLDATELRRTERRRFLRAFLRYDLIYLRRREKEALVCVQGYFESFYKAILAQSGTSELPLECPEATAASYSPKFEEDLDDEDEIREAVHSPSNSSGGIGVISDPLTRVSLSTNELAQWLACFDVDMALALADASTSGYFGRVAIGHWLKHLSYRGPRYGFDRENINYETYQFVPGLSNEADQDECRCDNPQLYQMLYSRFAEKEVYHKQIHLRMYRPRAWVFLDDARLYQPLRKGLHFQTNDVEYADIPFDDIIGPRRDPRLFGLHSLKTFFPQNEIKDISVIVEDAKKKKAGTIETTTVV